MANFEVLDEIPQTYRKQFIGDGANGVCFKTEDGDVFKEFIYTPTNQGNIEILSSLQSSFFTFPKTLVYVGEKNKDTLVGYKMDYVDGVPFDELNPNTRVEEVLESIKNIERAILELTRHHSILLFDLHNDNVLFQRDNQIKVLDTDMYEYSPSSETYENSKYNMRVWNEFMLYNFGCQFDAFYSELLNLRFEIALTNGKLKSSDILEEVICEMRKISHSEITSLDDYNEGLKLIKRKELL